MVWGLPDVQGVLWDAYAHTLCAPKSQRSAQVSQLLKDDRVLTLCKMVPVKLHNDSSRPLVEKGVE